MKLCARLLVAAAWQAFFLIMAGETNGPHAIDSTKTDKRGRAVYRTYGKIERLSPTVDTLLARDAVMEKLAEGFIWSEGPVWLRRQSALVFSDVPANKAYRWAEKDGLSVFLNPSGFTGDTGSTHPFREPGSNGLTTDSNENLILCQHGNRQIARLVLRSGTVGTFEPVASNFMGKKFNSPNDLCFAKNGNLYFTDPPYGLEGLDQSPIKEITQNGVYLVRPNGKVELITGKMTFPNGIALSPDQKTLYVNQSDPANPVIMAFTLKSDGTADDGKVFFDARRLAESGRPGMPDGLKVDSDGNLWSTGPGGVLIISPTGDHLGSLLTGEPTANCNWGDDGSTLYITCNHALLRIRTLVRGAGI